jgi:hypothetical protein
MRIVLFMAMAVSLISCQPEELDGNESIPCTLKLYTDFNPLASYRTTSFRYTDVNGNEKFINNPEGLEVTNVDFSKYVQVTAYAGNNFQPQTLCNWYLKKDGVVIDVQSVTYYEYEN